MDIFLFSPNLEFLVKDWEQWVVGVCTEALRNKGDFFFFFSGCDPVIVLIVNESDLLLIVQARYFVHLIRSK